MNILIAVFITFVITSAIWLIPYSEIIKENKKIKKILDKLR